MSKNIEDVLTSVCKYVEKITQKKVLKGKTSFTPQYDVPFFSIWINSAEQVPRDRTDYINQNTSEDSLIERSRGLMLIEFEVNGFGEGVISASRRLALSFGTGLWNEFECFNDVGLSEKRSVQNVSVSLDDAVFEERSSFSFVLYVPLPEEFIVDYFDKINISIENNREEKLYEFEVKGKELHLNQEGEKDDNNQ